MWNERSDEAVMHAAFSGVADEILNIPYRNERELVLLAYMVTISHTKKGPFRDRILKVPKGAVRDHFMTWLNTMLDSTYPDPDILPVQECEPEPPPTAA